MAAVLAEPLINGMAIARILPVHESGRRLRKPAPESPRWPRRSPTACSAAW
jgi:hypothetical protein